MDSLLGYRIFLAVADCASFSEAARQLALTPTKVSRAIADLEAGLGFGLLERTTRRVELTTAGARFAERIRPAVASLLEVSSKSENTNEINDFGEVRVACEPAIGETLVVPSLPGFAAQHPHAQIRVDMWDRPVSAENEGYDLTLSLRAQVSAQHHVIGRMDLALVASSAYIASHNRLYAAADVAQHKALVWSGLPLWSLRGSDPIQPIPSLFSNNINLIKNCCIAAKGIALLPAALVREELTSQSLVQLLDGFEPKPLSIVAGWGAQQKPLCGAQAFLDHLSGEIKRLRF